MFRRFHDILDLAVDKTTDDEIAAALVRQIAEFREVKAREVAMALAFLGSDAGVFVNGVNLNVDNGFMASMVTGQIDISTLAG